LRTAKRLHKFHLIAKFKYTNQGKQHCQLLPPYLLIMWQQWLKLAYKFMIIQFVALIDFYVALQILEVKLVFRKSWAGTNNAFPVGGSYL